MAEADPFVAGYLSNLAAGLTLGVINALTKKASQLFAAPPQKQALIRCYEAGSIALLPENDPYRKTVLPLLQEFFNQPEVQREMANLVRARAIDQEWLVETFEAYAGERLPSKFNFESRLATFVEAFLQTVVQEESLVEIIKVDQLRQANIELLSIAQNTAAIAQSTAAIQQALEQPQDIYRADVRLEFLQAWFNHSHSGIPSPFPEVEIDQYGFDKHGVPGWASIWAKFTLKNTGYKVGELEWEIDRAKTDLPVLFSIDDEYQGEIDRGPLGRIQPQTWTKISWKVYLRIAERDPCLFAQTLNSLEKYSIVINYHTVDIHGKSPQSYVVVQGDFQKFRNKILEHWEWRYKDLAQLVKP